MTKPLPTTTEPALADWREMGALPIASLVRTRVTVATVLGISRERAYAFVQRGELATVQIGGRKLVPVVALRRLLGEVPPLPLTDAETEAAREPA